MDVTRPMRATRPGTARRAAKGPGAFRCPADQVEVRRRVEIYSRQVQQQGRISWLPHRDTVNP